MFSLRGTQIECLNRVNKDAEVISLIFAVDPAKKERDFQEGAKYKDSILAG